MKSEDPELILMELKYCERCGGLWLRRKGSAGPYCPPCAQELMDLLVRQTKPRHPRLPVNHYSDALVRGSDLPKLVEDGGEA